MSTTKSKTKQKTRKKPTGAGKTSGTKELDTLARQIQDSHKACIGSVRTSLEHAHKTGQLLAQAKKMVPHGKWLPWLREHCQLDVRVAQNYMRIADHYQQIQAELQREPDLTLSRALQLVGRGGGAPCENDAVRQVSKLFAASAEDVNRKAGALRSIDRSVRSRVASNQKVCDFIKARLKAIYESVRFQAVKLAETADGCGEDACQIAWILLTELKKQVEPTALFLTEETAARATVAAPAATEALPTARKAG